jgi:5-methylcytosine-specific restriction enzyme subunit McrC
MQQIYLTEYKQSIEAYALSTQQRDLIAKHIGGIKIEPASGVANKYYLTPSSKIGVLEIENLAIHIKPKVSIDHLMFLMSYALDPKKWKQFGFNLAETDSIVEAVIPAFLRHLKKVFSRGVLKGYRQRNDSLTTVRGQIRFPDQLRKRFGIPIPIEVTYDEFTEDIPENQLIKAAISRLLQNTIRSKPLRRELRRYLLALDNVSLISFNPQSLPTIKISRLNERYEHALEISKLILRSSTFNYSSGKLRARSFIVDMNQVFEDFIVIALRENLGLTPHSFPQNAKGKRLYLDSSSAIKLKPDISWWRTGKCQFVGDVKYKELNKQARNSDLYQLLAYTTATHLPLGILIYAKDDSIPEIRTESHFIAAADKHLLVYAVDLANPPSEILQQIDQIGRHIKGFDRRTSLSQLQPTMQQV